MVNKVYTVLGGGFYSILGGVKLSKKGICEEAGTRRGGI